MLGPLTTRWRPAFPQLSLPLRLQHLWCVGGVVIAVRHRFVADVVILHHQQRLHQKHRHRPLLSSLDPHPTLPLDQTQVLVLLASGPASADDTERLAAESEATATSPTPTSCTWNESCRDRLTSVPSATKAAGIAAVTTGCQRVAAGELFNGSAISPASTSVSTSTARSFDGVGATGGSKPNSLRAAGVRAVQGCCW